MTAVGQGPRPTGAVAACPACGGAGRLRFRGRRVDGWQTASCRTCGVAYCTPRPTPEDLARTYGGSYFAGDGTGRVGYRRYRELPEANARRMWYDLRAFASDLLPSTGRVLDVGCGTGAFLAEADAAGWEVLGTEFSDEAPDRDDDRDVPIVPGLLLPGPSSGPFDLITFWHVLEHLVEPGLAVDGAVELLASGGVVVAEVPSWRSVGRLARGRAWAQLRPPEHINFFGPKTLVAFLERHGLSVERCVTTYPSLADRAARIGRPRDRVAAVAGEVAAQAGLGGYCRVVARRG